MTLLWQVQNALVEVFTAGVTGTVFKGSRPRSGNAPRGFLVVGSDGGETGSDPGVEQMSATQALSTMGEGAWREEAGTVTCAVWAWGGTSDIEKVRDAAQAMYAQCVAVVLANPYLNELLNDLADPLVITTVVPSESQTDQGPVVRIVFGVSYTALLDS